MTILNASNYPPSTALSSTRDRPLPCPLILDRVLLVVWKAPLWLNLNLRFTVRRRGRPHHPASHPLVARKRSTTSIDQSHDLLHGGVLAGPLDHIHHLRIPRPLRGRLQIISMHHLLGPPSRPVLLATLASLSMAPNGRPHHSHDEHLCQPAFCGPKMGRLFVVDLAGE